MRLDYIDINVQECHTPERAQATLTQIELNEQAEAEYNAKRLGYVEVSDLCKRSIQGTKVVTFRFSKIARHQVIQLFDYERETRDVTHMFTDRRLLPRRLQGSEEPSGMLDGIIGED